MIVLENKSCVYVRNKLNSKTWNRTGTFSNPAIHEKPNIELRKTITAS